MTRQVDHVVALLQNVMDRQGYDSFTRALYQSVATLHLQLFDNYGKWLHHLRLDGSSHEDHLTHKSTTHVRFGSLSQSNTWAFIGPWEFDTIEQERAWVCTAQLHQIMLFQLIWGEAANLRFLPECLCFIFFCASNAIALESFEEYAAEAARGSCGLDADDPAFVAEYSGGSADYSSAACQLSDAPTANACESHRSAGATQLSFVLRSAGTAEMPYREGDFLESIVAPVYGFLLAEMKGKGDVRRRPCALYPPAPVPHSFRRGRGAGWAPWRDRSGRAPQVTIK